MFIFFIFSKILWLYMISHFRHKMFNDKIQLLCCARYDLYILVMSDSAYGYTLLFTNVVHVRSPTTVHRNMRFWNKHILAIITIKNTLNVGELCITSKWVVAVKYYFQENGCYYNIHQSIPETDYICFTPNTTRSPTHISIDCSVIIRKSGIHNAAWMEDICCLDLARIYTNIV